MSKLIPCAKTSLADSVEGYGGIVGSYQLSYPIDTYRQTPSGRKTSETQDAFHLNKNCFSSSTNLAVPFLWFQNVGLTFSCLQCCQCPRARGVISLWGCKTWKEEVSFRPIPL